MSPVAPAPFFSGRGHRTKPANARQRSLESIRSEEIHVGTVTPQSTRHPGAVGCRTRFGASSGLVRPQYLHRGALHPRQRAGRARPDRRRGAEEPLEPAGRGREQAGRERQHRRRGGGARRAGRAHPGALRQHLPDERGPLQGAALRPGEELRTHRRARDRLPGAGGPRLRSGHVRARVHRTGQDPAGRDHLRLAGARHAAAPRHGAVQADHRRLPQARALHRAQRAR